MLTYSLLTILVIATTLLTYINSKFFKLPVTIAVTLFSLIFSAAVLLLNKFLPEMNQLINKNISNLDFGQLVINDVLGFLLFGAAFRTNVKGFRTHLEAIASMALLGTFLSTLLIGAMIYFLFLLFHQNISFINCLLFGALISPTDPVAAIGVLRKVGMPSTLELKMTGEALTNDGIAIVLFTTILELAGPQQQNNVVSNALLLLLREFGGGVVLGFLIGGLGLLFLKTTSNYKIEIFVTLSVVMGGHLLALELHVSPPITLVVAGLCCSAQGKENADFISHQNVMVFWELIEDFINVILFLLIGLEVFIIPLEPFIIKIALLAIPLLLFARLLSLLPIYMALKNQFEKYSLYVFTWGGLRGAVSIALALSLPVVLHRNEFLTITYIIAVFSIVVQGLTIKKLAMWLGFAQ